LKKIFEIVAGKREIINTIGCGDDIVEHMEDRIIFLYFNIKMLQKKLSQPPH
jgi:hypothetical protein